MLKKIGIYYVVLMALLLACSKVPITGRKQLNMLPESMLTNESLTAYRQFLSKNKVMATGPEATMVRQVGERMSLAVDNYLRSKGYSKRIQGYKWEFNLVEDKNVNAWCMPGGKVVVYSGLLPVAQNETGLAVVMSHEIAHAIARHGNERMSQLLLAEMGGVALAVAMSEKPERTRNLMMAAYGLGATVGIMLPFSRSHESEADKMGLVFMALAGYNPEEAVNFWQRMADSHKGGKVPEFLSTHPSDETRIQKIKEFLPRALKYYQR